MAALPPPALLAAAKCRAPALQTTEVEEGAARAKAAACNVDAVDGGERARQHSAGPGTLSWKENDAATSGFETATHRLPPPLLASSPEKAAVAGQRATDAQYIPFSAVKSTLVELSIRALLEATRNTDCIHQLHCLLEARPGTAPFRKSRVMRALSRNLSLISVVYVQTTRRSHVP